MGLPSKRPDVFPSLLARLLAASLLAALAASPAPSSAAEEVWVPTWTASPQPVWDGTFFANPSIPPSLRNQTVRQYARVSVGSGRIRVVLSNEYGKAPVTLGAVHVAMGAAHGAIVPGTDKALTFGGSPSVTIPPGAPAVSDSVDFKLPALGKVAVSFFVPEVAAASTWHNDAQETTYLSADGNFVGEARFDAAQKANSRIYLTKILAQAAPGTRAVVLFGDSITDGDGSTPNADRRWPDVLAERLQKAGARVAVANQGISGCRVLRDRMGDNALARLDRDVLAQEHADTVVLMMGINDVGWPGTILVRKGEAAPTAEEIIAGYQQIVARAHAHGFKILGATLTPFEDAFHNWMPLYGFNSPEKEAKREALNRWIRTSGAFDGVIDFDALTRDPANPKHLKAEFDSGDHLHPNDAGYKAMAESIDLKLLGVM
ncbi:MAG TPA: SGNH/GDSL hydrolase family protein [Anaeromyxobacter sp.]|nr:SGNH/GDSL hydrolase family protein [Anaeromyxobacter sp.]